ncbi:5-amino-6-(5-phosphoribosylamino)uracil reductase [Microvirga vignae]|uniref:5-amino-6-(5-phosphoribosylamino)uracil reductase n=2 Tax=Microvirga vignae TaxID=1225564 RepID=A0A0H1R806_9HYPH|nr:5-amino-6-(5-phosphoribosylamino)uracil reductase [Microvirga vignae]
MVSSIDGRLLVDRWTPPAAGIDSDIVHRYYDQVAARFDADGWIVGRKTMEDYAGGTARTPRSCPDNLRAPHVADRKGRNVAVAIDPHGRLHYGSDNAGSDHIVTVIGEQVTDEYLAELHEDGVSYLFAGPDGHDLHRAMDILGGTFGIKTLLLEGGGTINGAFLKVGLIDEISLLVYPGIDGLAGVPSIFGYAGEPDEKPAAGQSLRLLTTETLEGGMVWLHYRVEESPSS